MKSNCLLAIAEIIAFANYKEEHKLDKIKYPGQDFGLRRGIFVCVKVDT